MDILTYNLFRSHVLILLISFIAHSNSNPISYCEGHQSMKSDIFSFGGVLVEILTGKSVFEVLKNEDDSVTNVSDADHTIEQALRRH